MKAIVKGRRFTVGNFCAGVRAYALYLGPTKEMLRCGKKGPSAKSWAQYLPKPLATSSIKRCAGIFSLGDVESSRIAQKHTWLISSVKQRGFGRSLTRRLSLYALLRGCDYGSFKSQEPTILEKRTHDRVKLLRAKKALYVHEKLHRFLIVVSESISRSDPFIAPEAAYLLSILVAS